MKEFASISEYVSFLRSRLATIPHAEREGAREAGALLVHDARALIGTEDPDWRPLAQSTVALKEELGYLGRVSPTDPLYRTGHMRGSIESETSAHEVVLGTYDPVAEEQEFGTKSIPARPFIGLTMFRHGHEAATLAYEYVMAAFCGHQPPHGHRGSVDD